MKVIGKKIKMTQVWEGDGIIPVTVVKVIGDSKSLEIFSKGDRVRVSGTSKGKGFQGVVKRHGFHGGPKTHGQKNRLRAPGSIGATAPQRVIKGKKMAGHMGVRRTTIKNLLVVDLKKDEGILMLKGAVPGMAKSTVEITKKS